MHEHIHSIIYIRCPRVRAFVRFGAFFTTTHTHIKYSFHHNQFRIHNLYHTNFDYSNSKKMFSSFRVRWRQFLITRQQKNIRNEIECKVKANESWNLNNNSDMKSNPIWKTSFNCISKSILIKTKIDLKYALKFFFKCR